jgi:hypothetical protein
VKPGGHADLRMCSPWVTLSQVSVNARKSSPEEVMRSVMLCVLLQTDRAFSRPSLGKEA